MIVFARNILAGHDRDEPLRRTHATEIDMPQARVRTRADSDRRMQGTLRQRQVIGVERLAAHVQVSTLVRNGLPDSAADRTGPAAHRNGCAAHGTACAPSAFSRHESTRSRVDPAGTPRHESATAGSPRPVRGTAPTPAYR